MCARHDIEKFLHEAYSMDEEEYERRLKELTSSSPYDAIIQENMDELRMATTKMYRPDLSNITTTNIGERCTIHSHVWMGDTVSLGRDCRVQAFCFIPNGVRLGNKVFLGPGVTFTNDKHPPSDEWLPTIVMDGASIGANATIICGVTIGRDSVVGAGSVVTKDVPEGATVMGNPAKICGK